MCSGPAGACPAASGTGSLNASVNLASGGTVVFTIIGTVTPGTATLVNTASVAAPAGTFDPNAANNSDTVTTPAAPIGFYAVTPCRVADTRSSTPPALGANSSRDFVAAGMCGIPADARAVAIVLTVASPTDGGDLRLYGAGTPLPVASTINFAAGHTRANNAIVPLGAGGAIRVQCDMPVGSTGQTHFLFDVTGYFK
jgi:hypothetical protein